MEGGGQELRRGQSKESSKKESDRGLGTASGGGGVGVPNSEESCANSVARGWKKKHFMVVFKDQK